MRKKITVIGLGLGVIAVTAAWGPLDWVVDAAQWCVDAINYVWYSATGDEYMI